MAISRQIWSAWAKSFLYPRSAVLKALRELRAVSPESQAHQPDPETPHSAQTLHALDQKLRQGEISPTSSARKVRKALEKAFAEKVVMERDLERRDAAAELDRAARGNGKRKRFPQGYLFDHNYRESHAEELAARQGEEQRRRQARRPMQRAVPHAEISNSAQRLSEAMPTEEQSIAWLASIGDELLS